jgi:hypothetical protein
LQPPIESNRPYGRLAPHMASRVLLAIFFVAVSAYATTVQRLGLEDLAKKAHTIVVGRVTNSRTYWSANGKLILTNYTFQVDESIKGQAARNVEITTIGGRIGDVELRVSGMPSFQAGENAVVFLEQSAGYQTVLGLGQGKFTVTAGQVVNSVGDLSFPDGRPGIQTKMPLPDFKNRIRTILSR